MSNRADLPTIEGENTAVWAAAREHRLMIAQCDACGALHHYPRPHCPACWSPDVSLVQASGKATVYTYSTVYMNDLPPFNEQLPYITAAVDLAEGPRMVTRLIDIAEEDLSIGMAVEAVFVDLDDQTTIVHFRPSATRASEAEPAATKENS